MSLILALAAASIMSPPVRLIEAPTITLGEPIVRIGDVIQLDRFPQSMQIRIAPLAIARLPTRDATYTLDRSAVIRLLKRRVPGLRVAQATAGFFTFMVPPRATAADAGNRKPYLPPPPVVERGVELRLVSRVGPIRIERTVTAMQESMTGRRIFVRDEDGQVFSARFDRNGDAR